MAAQNPFASSVPDFDPYALVQTRRAPRHSTGYYFVRNLLFVGAVAGGLVAAYRNDVFRDLAQKMGQEQRYLDAEKFLVGSPGWGTPRSMEPVLKQAADAETGSLAATAPTATADDASAAALPTSASTANVAATAAVTAAAPSQVAPAPEPVASPRREPEPVAAAAPLPAPRPVSAPEAPPAPARRSAGRDGLSPVSLNSLPVLNRGAPVQTAAFAPSRPAPAHVAAAARTAAPAPRPAAVDRGRAKAIKVTLDEDEPAPAARSPFVRHEAAPPAPPPEPRPAPVAAKPVKPEPPKSKASDVHSGDNPLLAAVRGAVRARPAKSSVPAAK